MSKHLDPAMPAPSAAAAPATDMLEAIRAQVMRGIALNREPGYHFAGNFLDLSYDHVGTDYTALSVDVAPHCAEADGQLNLSGFAILADLVMAAAVRAGLPPHTRLATVTMNLQFTGAARTRPARRPRRDARFRAGRSRAGRASARSTSAVTPVRSAPAPARS